MGTMLVSCSAPMAAAANLTVPSTSAGKEMRASTLIFARDLNYRIKQPRAAMSSPCAARGGVPGVVECG